MSAGAVVAGIALTALFGPSCNVDDLSTVLADAQRPAAVAFAALSLPLLLLAVLVERCGWLRASRPVLRAVLLVVGAALCAGFSTLDWKARRARAMRTRG